jgi:hypothetical protein
MDKCFSCGKECDPEKDTCRGCGEIVCVECVEQYDHYMNGEHDRRLEMVKTELGEGLLEFMRSTK